MFKIATRIWEEKKMILRDYLNLPQHNEIYNLKYVKNNHNS